jgi:hypothetical protein
MNLVQRGRRQVRAWPAGACLLLLAATPLSARQPKLSRTLAAGLGPVHVAFSPDGKTLASGDCDGTIKL